MAENDAALRLARALVPEPEAAGLRLDPAFTGRVNIRATGPGIVRLDAGAIARLNAVDPMITLATVPEWQRVTEGMMVGTVKIISYAVQGAVYNFLDGKVYAYEDPALGGEGFGGSVWGIVGDGLIVQFLILVAYISPVA